MTSWTIPTAFDYMTDAQVTATQNRSFTSDVTEALLAGIGDASEQGYAELLFQPGGYAVSQTLNIGNGTPGSVSTTAGIRLKGSGPPIPPPYFGNYSRTSPVELRWVSPQASPMISVNGPVQGWGVEDILLNGQNSASEGILIVSGQFGVVRNAHVFGFLSGGIVSTTVPVFGGLCTDSIHNSFENIMIGVPLSPGALGMVLTGGANASTDYADCVNIFIALPGASPLSNNFGLYLQCADTNSFRNLHMSGGPGTCAIAFDYTVASVFPSSNIFFGLDTGGGNTAYATAGNPGPQASPNKIYGRSALNGMPPPSGIPNLVEF